MTPNFDPKRFLDYAGLASYDEKIKAFLASADAATLQSAKDYTDEQIGDLGTGVATVAAAITAEANRAKGVEGTLASLTTEDNDSLVAAINEVDAHADAITAKVGTVPAKVGETTTETVVAYVDAKVSAAGSDADTKIGTLSNLTTDLKTNLVAAINELDSHADATATLVGSGYGKVSADEGAADHTVKSYIDANVLKTANEAVVTVEKLGTADEGYLSTYVVKQNGTQVGSKINIPKDYLVKSGSLQTCATANSPVDGLAVGDKYLDFVVNTRDNSVTEEHIYLPVNDLFDSYTSGSAATDAIVVTVDNSTNKISAAITDATIARTKIDADFEAQIAKAEAALQKAADGTYKTVSTRIDEEAKDATYKAAEGEQAKVTIKGALDDIYAQIGEGGSVATQISDAIDALDATVSVDGTATNGNGLTLQVVEENGKLKSVSGSINVVSETDIAALFPAAQNS